MAGGEQHGCKLSYADNCVLGRCSLCRGGDRHTMSEQAVRLGIPAVQIEMPQQFRDEITAAAAAAATSASAAASGNATNASSSASSSNCSSKSAAPAKSASDSAKLDNPLFERFAQALLTVYERVVEHYAPPADVVPHEWVSFPLAKLPPSLGGVAGAAALTAANTSAGSGTASASSAGGHTSHVSASPGGNSS